MKSLDRLVAAASIVAAVGGGAGCRTVYQSGPYELTGVFEEADIAAQPEHIPPTADNLLRQPFNNPRVEALQVSFDLLHTIRRNVRQKFGSELAYLVDVHCGYQPESNVIPPRLIDPSVRAFRAGASGSQSSLDDSTKKNEVMAVCEEHFLQAPQFFYSIPLQASMVPSLNSLGILNMEVSRIAADYGIAGDPGSIQTLLRCYGPQYADFVDEVIASDHLDVDPSVARLYHEVEEAKQTDGGPSIELLTRYEAARLGCFYTANSPLSNE